MHQGCLEIVFGRGYSVGISIRRKLYCARPRKDRQWSYAFPFHTLEKINVDNAPDEPIRILAGTSVGFGSRPLHWANQYLR